MYLDRRRRLNSKGRDEEHRQYDDDDVRNEWDFDNHYSPWGYGPTGRDSRFHGRHGGVYSARGQFPMVGHHNIYQYGWMPPLAPWGGITLNDSDFEKLAKSP